MLIIKLIFFGVAAGYPEKHLESPSFIIRFKRLKAKVDAGADYGNTNVF
jgi:methylenetetrahydrofolate reductase (NADPH)